MPSSVSTSTQVHNIETTAHSGVPDDYQAFLLRKRQSLFSDRLDFYRTVDPAGSKNYAFNLQNCRKMSWIVRHFDTGELRVSSNHCRLKWCPLCAASRRWWITKAVTEWMSERNRCKFITLTQKHVGTTLREQIEDLYRNFRLLRKSKEFRQYVHGGVWFFQVKKADKTQQWHPHLHCLCDAKFYPWKKLSAQWLKTTGTSSVVDIRAVRSEEQTASYVARYATSPCNLEDLDKDSRVDVFDALHGKRICGTWGTAKTLKLTPPKSTDRSDWQTVGRWSTIIRMAQYDDDAKEVLKCFLTNKPLNEPIDFRDVEGFIDDIPSVDIDPSDLSSIFQDERSPPS